MKHVIQAVWTLKQEPAGPLVDHLEPFANHLVEQGYCRRYIGAKIRVVASFSGWLQAQSVTASDVIHAHAERYIQCIHHPYAIERGDVATLRHVIRFLQHMGIARPPDDPVDRTPIQQVVYEFGGYLLNNRGLSHQTFKQDGPFVECFLTECFAEGPLSLSALSGADIIGFIHHQSAHLSTARAKVATNALRAFLRYVVYRGDISADLVEAVPSVAAWSMTAIPRAISQDHIQAVLAHCPRDTPMGRRDYAILMLLVHLGLRSGEIVSLTLDSIDWEGGSITVSGKGDQRACLPLPTEVGEALADYLRQGRPHCKDRALFLRALAPIRGLGGQETIGTIVNAAVRRAGVNTPTRGAHQFRHALATQMLRQGASLTEIGSLLRHQHPKTTNIYAKVDVDALRSISMAWPGGAQ